MTSERDELPPSFLEWLAEVNRIMKRDWHIDTDQAGTEIDRLFVHWHDGERPEEYVIWFAEKYDLLDFGLDDSTRLAQFKRPLF